MLKKKNASVLLLGEDALTGAGRYLAAILKWGAYSFDYLPDGRPVPESWMRRPYKTVVLSDYRYSNWTLSSRKRLIQRVGDGLGLLMIGGWASFTGQVGGYAGTDLEALLPVRCVPGDDRIQNARGALLFPDKNPPLVCGYHKAFPKPGSTVTKVFRDVLYKEGRLKLGPPKPALVLGRYGRGKTAAFLTDCAPHWAGGLVDWGRKRHAIRLGKDTVEVGETYLQFFANLIRSLF